MCCAVIGNELKIPPTSVSQGLKKGFTLEDIGLCSTMTEGLSEINSRVVVLHLPIILTLGGKAASLKISDFGSIISCL